MADPTPLDPQAEVQRLLGAVPAAPRPRALTERLEHAHRIARGEDTAPQTPRRQHPLPPRPPFPEADRLAALANKIRR